MYRLRRQPWKPVPLRPPELCCNDESPPSTAACSGMPGKQYQRVQTTYQPKMNSSRLYSSYTVCAHARNLRWISRTFQTRVLTSQVNRGVEAESGLLAEGGDRLWSPAINGQRQSLVRCHQLHSMKAAVVHRFHTGAGESWRHQWASVGSCCTVPQLVCTACLPVYCRGGVRSGIVADPETSPVQLHGNVIVISFIQQHSTVFISGNLRQRTPNHLGPILYLTTVGGHCWCLYL